MNIKSVIGSPKHFIESFKRFPFVLLACISITIILIYLVEFKHNLHIDTIDSLVHITTVLGLGLVLSLAIYNFAEKVQVSSLRKHLYQLITIVFMLVFYFIKPHLFSDFERSMRIFTIFMSFLFLVFWLPFYSKNDEMPFWHYVKTFVIRLLIALFFTYIIFAGLSLALIALDKLFGVNIPDKTYQHLWLILQGIFTPVFFLSHLESNYSRYETELNYPKFLKILVLNILLPIVSLYMLILYVYGGKILISWTLPIGWVSNLVLSFSVIGLLSFFLVYPMKNDGNIYISLFFKWFFKLMLPLLLLLYIAIFTRINAYGITELRYYVLLLAIYLTFNAIYFLFNKYKNIKIIFFSFLLLAFFSSFGPWGAYSVSKNSQKNRFEKLATEHNILKNGIISKTQDSLSTDHIYELSSIVDYLITYHGVKSMKVFFNEEDYLSILNEGYRYSQTQLAMELMGLRYINKYQYIYTDIDNEFTYFNFSCNNNLFCDIYGYNMLFFINQYHTPSNNNLITLNDSANDLNIEMVYSFNSNIYTVTITHKNIIKEHFEINIISLYKSLYNTYNSTDKYNLPSEIMTLSSEGKQFNIKLVVRVFNGLYSKTMDSFKHFTIDGMLLINTKSN